MKRYALCIGNNDYQILDKLKYAVADAASVAEKLISLGFDVDEAYNLGRDDLCSAVVSLSDKISNYDAVLLYYAGHGYEINNQNLLIPIDFNDRDDPKTANHRAYAINELLELLCGNEDKTKIIILDACRKELGIIHTFCSP